jgi:hypothetical protein
MRRGDGGAVDSVGRETVVEVVVVDDDPGGVGTRGTSGSDGRCIGTSVSSSTRPRAAARTSVGPSWAGAVRVSVVRRAVPHGDGNPENRTTTPTPTTDAAVHRRCHRRQPARTATS